MPEPEPAGTAGVRGVLRPGGAAGRFTLARHDPPADLAPFVEWLWVVRWDLRGQPPHEQQILPNPNVHLAFEAHGAHVHGVDLQIFTRRLSGRGKVLGVRFRPGGFRPLCGEPVAALTGRVVPAARFLGPAADRARAAIMAAGTDAEMAGLACGLLRAAAPLNDPAAARTAAEAVGRVAAIVDRITGDRQLRRARDLAAGFGMNERRLQRLFAEYVGVSPKWVMRRARLGEAALAADSGEAVDWAALAADLGYADQAHLTRDFTATIGVPPARYARAGNAITPAT